MPNLSQVVDIDRKGNYVRDQGGTWGEYMLHMAKVQKLMVDKFGVKARNNAISAKSGSFRRSSAAEIVPRTTSTSISFKTRTKPVRGHNSPTRTGLFSGAPWKRRSSTI